MRILSVQVQPSRSPGMDMKRVERAFRSIARIRPLVKGHSFDEGDDRGPYFNFTFSTERPKRLWTVIQETIYASRELGPHLALASIVVCSGKTERHAHSVLFHFDASVRCASPNALGEE